MELSPLAREKLAKAGELSPEEKEKIKMNEELTAILADFFTGKIDVEGLWKRMKAYKDEGKDSIIKELELRLIHTLSLGGSDMDFDKYSSGILSMETLKEINRYPDIESRLKTIKKMRQQYQDEKNRVFNSMKNEIGAQVRMAAQKMTMQNKNKNVSIDIEGSIEASVRNSQQWRSFILNHEKSYGKKFEDAISDLTNLI